MLLSDGGVDASAITGAAPAAAVDRAPAAATDVVASFTTGAALDAGPDALDGALGAPVVLGALSEDTLRGVLCMLDVKGLGSMRFTSIWFGAVVHAEIAARYAQRLAAADRCKEALTDAEARAIAAALRSPPRAVVSEGFNVELTGENAERLNPEGWLVDEVVNFYMALLQDRDDRHCKADPTARPCHFFNSFFVSKLMGTDAELYSYDGVRRFTKKVDLYGKRLVVVPINVGNLHWTLAAVYMEQKTVRYYDSMGGSGSGLVYLRALLRYLGDEHQDKKGVPFDSAGWTMVPTTRNTPQQLNGFDCGVFASYCAHYVSLGAKPSFSQQHMPHLRRRMMADILDKKIHGS